MTEYFDPSAPPAPADAPTQIAIVVNGVEFGAVDVRTLPARAQFDLEDMQGAYDLLAWLQHYAGVREADLPALREELADMNVQAILDLTVAISTAIGQALRLPNATRPAWRQRSTTTVMRRSGR